MFNIIYVSTLVVVFLVKNSNSGGFWMMVERWRMVAFLESSHGRRTFLNPSNQMTPHLIPDLQVKYPQCVCVCVWETHDDMTEGGPVHDRGFCVGEEAVWPPPLQPPCCTKAVRVHEGLFPGPPCDGGLLFLCVPPTHGSIVCVLAPHVLFLCHPAENVTLGSKSKVNLILIHLIEEANPQVESLMC